MAQHWGPNHHRHITDTAHMAKRFTRKPTPAEVTLGQRIQAMRLAKGLNTRALGKLVNVPEQQITRYENGSAFIPIEMLEALAREMGEEIPKRIIRRISTLRHLERVEEEEKEELEALYCEAFPDVTQQD